MDNLLAYTRDIKDTTIDISKTSVIHVQFSIGLISSIGSVFIQILIGHIEFHLVKSDTSFLLYFTDMEQLSVYFNNIDKSPILSCIYIPAIPHFDHPFLLWKSSLNSFVTQFFDHTLYYLIEIKLRQLYRRFTYLSVIKLCLLLGWLGHQVSKPTFVWLLKYRLLYQKYSKLLGYFKFISCDDGNLTTLFL